jgi:threonine dehydratase
MASLPIIQGSPQGSSATDRRPSIADVYTARARIAPVITPTALLRQPLLADALGCDVLVKHENHNPTCAFKVRGGLNLIASLAADERRRGVITASTGNHGQSIAFACQREGVACAVYVPRGNNPEKNAAMRAMGAVVVEHGRDFDEAREEVERVVQVEGRRYVHSANEPLLIAGVATYALEIFEAVPRVDFVFVPIGGGSGAAGLVTIRDALGLPAKIIGVQAVRADAFARSWRGGKRVTGERADTFAEGMATRVTFDLPYGILERSLDDIVTLDEDELAAGVRLALSTTHNLAEGAGAAPIAAARKIADRIRGRSVVCVMSGGNIDTATLARILSHTSSPG